MIISELPPLMLAGIAIGMFILSLALAVLFVVYLPRDYFANPRRKLLPPKKRPVLRLAARIGKNVVGWMLILLGIAFSMPGMPGEGILTALIGLVLIDFPGKSRFEQRMIRVDWIRKALNRLRVRFHRTPFQKNKT